ncbi:hypothetical protein J0910_03565 [Nocardiopsis sp. CNT-189]|uniref:DUF6782 family putative metallopeptidase n=1 Tax=Nocardiopsis oceanisediminis TaxID=2816862 RepID=UPI003B29EABC
MILLVAAIAAAAVTAGYGREIAGMVRTAIDCAAQTGTCPTGDSASSGEEPSEPDGNGAAPVLPGGEAGIPDPLDCWGWVQGACDFGQGMWLEGSDMATEAVEGAQSLGCHFHICNPDDFRETWSATGDGLWHTVTDPIGAAQDSWDAATAGIRGDYNAGHEERSAGRVALIVGSSVFGAIGLGIRSVPDRDLPAGTVATHLATATREGRMGNVGGAERAAENAERLAEASEERAREDPTQDNLDQAERDRRDAERARLEAKAAPAFELLLETETGRGLNGFLHRQGTQIEFVNDPDRRGHVMYDPHTDTIIMGEDFLDTDPVVAASRLAHEITHARQSSEGGLPDPTRMDRDLYIKSALGTEADAVVSEIRVYEELREQGHDIPITEWETVYNESYESYMEEAEGTGMSTGRAEENADIVARGELARLIGTQNASVGNIPYTEYYGNIWDQY